MNSRLFGTMTILGLLMTACADWGSIDFSPTATPHPAPLPINTTPFPTPLPFDLFAGQPCEAPCWMNLRPGVTTRDEARRVLNSTPDLNTDCFGLFNEDEPFGCNGFAVFFDRSKIIERIDFSPTSQLTLSKVIQRYGDPTELYFHHGGIPEAATTIIDVAFVEHGVWLEFEHPVAIDYSVTPSMVAKSVAYLPVGSHDYYDSEYIQVMGVSKTTWQGYVDYRLILMNQ